MRLAPAPLPLLLFVLLLELALGWRKSIIPLCPDLPRGCGWGSGGGCCRAAAVGTATVDPAARGEDHPANGDEILGLPWLKVNFGDTPTGDCRCWAATVAAAAADEGGDPLANRGEAAGLPNFVAFPGELLC